MPHPTVPTLPFPPTLITEIYSYNCPTLPSLPTLHLDSKTSNSTVYTGTPYGSDMPPLSRSDSMATIEEASLGSHFELFSQ